MSTMTGYVMSTAVPNVVTTEGMDPNASSADPSMMCEYIPGVVSNETSRGLHQFYVSYGRVHGYIAIAVCLFGVLSNSANIIVLTRKNMASSTNTLLLWLAVSDLMTMLSYLPFAIHFYIMEPGDPRREPFSSPEFSWICFLLFHASFSIVCHTIAIWLTIALAIFRYIYICKPTSGAYYCSQQRARFVVIIVIILTIIICIPNYAVNTYGVSTIPGESDVSDNVTGMNNILEKDALTLSKVGSYYYPRLRRYTVVDEVVLQINNWIHAILIKLVPCFMLTTLTLLLVHAMHKAYRKRLKLKSQGRKAESEKHGEHNRTTGMLLAVVFLFTLTELPQGILTLMNIFITCFTDVVYYRLGDLLDIMALINNSVNFVLYCTMSTQFRTTFAEIFCPRRSARPKWLKLRLIKAKREDKNSIEVPDKDNKNNRRNNNCGVPPKNNDIECGLHVNDLKNKEVPDQNYHDDHNHQMEAIDSQVDNDKLPLTTEEKINGISPHTHTHGFSPDHSHV